MKPAIRTATSSSPCSTWKAATWPRCCTRRHALEPIRAAAIALEICEQLAKFHSWQSSVVHGDIKPSNIHLGPHDTVRLLDFGIAKRLRLGPDGVANATNSVDTAIVHLAGALGVPVWVALGTRPDWRWLLKRDDSPWYPTMRLFRRSHGEEWSDVFARMAEELGTLRPLPL